MSPRRMTTSQFKTKCLEVVEEVARTRQPVVVTKRGKAVAQVLPVAPPQRRHSLRSLRAALRGMVEIRGDIISPIDVEWNADR